MPVAALVVVLASWVSAPATAQSNNTPAFTEGADATRTIDENAVAGSDVGLPVTATDLDAGDTLTYSLTGAAADAFSVDPITGQIWTLAALDFEAATRYRVTVTVRDDSGTANAAASIAVVIDVIDVAERPHAPAAPLVATTSRTALKVSWTEPDRNGGPAITGYTLRYRARARDSDTWGTWSGSVASDGTATSANLTGLTRNRLYEVQVRASNGELDSAWSASGAGATPAANAAVCGRSEKVREAIVDAIAGVDDCMDVTAAQLRAITGTLDLSDEGIGSLQPGDFNGMSGITTLNLSDNDIAELPAFVFWGLTSLETLDLRFNKITMVRSSAFAGLAQVTLLRMFGGRIKAPLHMVLEPGAFSGLPELTSLEAGGNRLSVLPARIFDPLAKVTSIDLRGNTIHVLPRQAFATLTALTWLNLSENVIRHLRDVDLSSQTGLQRLYLDGNNLERVPDGLFAGKPGLADGLLHLNNQLLMAASLLDLPITLARKAGATDTLVLTMPSGAPFNVDVPVVVTAETSRVVPVSFAAGDVSAEITVPRGTTTHGVTAKIGDLTSITLPPNHAGYRFTGSSAVIQVHAPAPYCGRTAQVRAAILHQAGKLDCADLVAADLAAITELDLSIYALSDRGVANPDIDALQTDDFAGLTALRSLSLNLQQIDSLPEGVFDDLRELRELNLNNNALSRLPHGIFSQLGNLETLILTNQQDSPDNYLLNELPPGVFGGLSRLRTLALRGNAIAAVDANLFAGLTSLRTLDLADNRVESLPDGVFLGLHGLQEVSLRYRFAAGDDVAAIEQRRARMVSLSLVPGASRGEFKVRVNTGAPFAIAVPVEVVNGAIDGSATATVRVETGRLESGVVTVQHGADTQSDAVVEIGTALPEPPRGSNASGYSLHRSDAASLVVSEAAASGGICNRTPQVRAALLAAVRVNDSRVQTCNQVQVRDLAAIERLNLADKGITAITAGDFEHLSGLVALGLGDNRLETLPAGALGHLPALRNINLSRNRLAALPDGVFDGLTLLGQSSQSPFVTGGIALGSNLVDPLPLFVALEPAGAAAFRVRVHTAAPFRVVIPVRVANGTVSGSGLATAELVVEAGERNSDAVTVTRDPATGAPVTVSLGTLPGLPNEFDYSGMAFKAATSVPLELIPAVPEVSIDDAAAAESGTMVFAVSLDRASGDRVSLSWATTDGTATTAGRDYTGVTAGGLTFLAGETQRSLSVELGDDLFMEDDETFQVTISQFVNAVGAANGVTATGTIHDDDGSPRITVTDAQAGEADGALAFRVTRTGDATQTVTVDWAAADDSAVAPADYDAGQDGQITFAAGEREHTISVAIEPDTLDESDESLLLVLSSPVNATLARTTARGVVIDDDDPPFLSITDGRASEADGAVRLAVSLDAASGRQVVAYWIATDGDARTGSDYTAPERGALTIEPGTMTKELVVPVTDDAIDEPDEESFSVVLIGAQHAWLAAGSATAVATIADDDDPPVLSIEPASVAESGGVATLGASLDRASARVIDAAWSTEDGTATAGLDYVAVAGEALRFAPGETATTIRVRVLPDSLSEIDEHFTVRAAPSAHGLFRSAAAPAAIVVLDDDPEPTLTVADVVAPEGSGRAAFIVALDAESGAPVVVDYVTAAGSADPGIDYLHVAGTLTFAAAGPGSAAQTVRTVEVALYDDALVEAAETFSLTLSGPVGAVFADGAATVTAGATIVDDDGLVLAVADAEAAESDPAIVFTVRLSRPSRDPVRVRYETSDDTATAGEDYTAARGRLSFEPGATRRAVTVAVIDDEVEESVDPERFRFTLTNPAGAALADGAAIGSIIDDDTTLISVADVAGFERDGVLRFRLVLDRPADREVTVAYATEDGTATAGEDYRHAGGAVRFAIGSREREVPVTVLGDDTAEQPESFLLKLSNPVGAALADTEATGTIAEIEVQTDVCERTAAVRDAIVAATGAARCELVTRSQLGRIGSLDLANSGITALASGDFDGLSTLTTIDLADNGLTALPEDVLSGLQELTELDLSGNALPALPEGILSGRVRLESLDLDDNEIAALPGALFADARDVKVIRLRGNALKELPEGLFAGLTKLSTRGAAVSLTGNPGTPFPIHVSLEQGSGATARVVLHTGAPVPLDFTVHVLGGGTVSGSTQAPIRVPAGARHSAYFEVVRDPGSQSPVSIELRQDELPTATLNTAYAVSGAALRCLTGGCRSEHVLPGVTSGTLTTARASESTGSLVFGVTLDTAPAADLALQWEAGAATDTATAGSDYTPSGGALAIAAGATAGSITLQVVDDDLHERNETVTIRLAGPAVTGAPAVGVIADDDPAALRLPTGLELTEGTARPYGVALSAQPRSAVTVALTTDGVLTVDPGGLTFTARDWNDAQTVVVTAVDNIDTGDAAATVTHAVSGGGFGFDGLGPVELAVSIRDDESPGLSVADITVAEDASAATVTVSVAPPAADPVTVTYRTIDGTAQAGTDYTSATGTLSLAAQATSATFTVAITDDALDEDDETFVVELGNPHNATVASDRPPATVTIADNDEPPELRIGDAEGAEAAAGESGDEARTLVFPVALNRASGRDIEIAYVSSDGSATSGEDFAPLAGDTLVIAAGELAQAITVTIRDDQIDEAARETFTIVLTPAPGHANVVDGTGVGTIADNDQTVLGIADASASEGAGAVRIPVLLSAVNSRTVTVDWRTVIRSTDTATTADFRRVAGRTLSIPAGADSAELVVTLVEDSVDEANETFAVMLDWQTSGNALVDPDRELATATITDDDARSGAAWTTTITRNGTEVETIAEGQGGDQALTLSVSTGNGTTFSDARSVTLAPAPAGAAGAAGAASLGDDYTLDSTVLVLPPGRTSVSTAFTILDDRFAEDAESVLVDVEVEGVGAIGAAALTITDDDTALAPVTGAQLEAKAGALRVSWDRVAGAASYRVQWKSDAESFDDAATQGREALVADGSTEYTISGLSALTTYTVRVSAHRTGYTEGEFSAEVSGSPVPATPRLVRYLRRDPVGMPSTDNRIPVRGKFLVGVRFGGIDAPTGVAEDDLEVTGGTVETMRMAQDGDGQVYLVTVLVDPGAREVRFKVRENAIAQGNTAAEVTYPAAAPLSAAFETTAAVPLRGDLELFVNFSEALQQRGDGVAGGGSSYFVPEHDLQIVNGRFVSAHAETAARYRVVVRPDGDLEGELRVTLPAEAVAAAGDTNNRNLGATFTIEADTEVDDATLAALTMEATTLADTAVTLVPEFDPEITTYRAEAESIYDVLTTITATARDRETEVTITPVDYDRIRPGHQVQLVTTDQTITITVTAEDGVTMKEYTVTAARRLPPGKLVLANTPETMSEGGSAQYTVSLSIRPPWQVAVNLEVSGDDDVTVSPEALTYNPAHGNWDRARTITVSAAEDDDAEDDVATVTHTVVEEPFPDHRYLAPAESFTVRVDDPDAPEQVTGVSVTGVYRGLEVGWTGIAGAGAYRVQWKSGSEEFADAAANGREALVAGAATEYTISGLTALQTYTVRVIAVNTGHGDGTPSAEVSGSPVQAEVRMRRLSAGGGTVIDDDTIPVRGSFWMGVAFAGAAEPVGVTEADFEVTGGSIDEFFETRSAGVSVYRLRIVVADGVASVTFTVREDALEGGRNASASVTYPVGDPLRVTFEADSEAPLRSRMTLTMRTSLAIVEDTGADQDAFGFSPGEDLTVENGWLDGVSRISSMEYRFGIVPRGRFEGTLRVRVPRGVMQAEEEEHAFNEEASFEIEVDTLTDDATLASLAVTAAGASGGEPVALSPRFIAAVRSYGASVPYAVETVTVAAAARDKEGRTAIVPTDADRDADGHQVDLAEGATAITITVTAEDGVTTRDYTVTVDRAVPERVVILSQSALALLERNSVAYQVRLASKPTAAVTVTAGVFGDSDVSVSPDTLTFTVADWQAVRSLTVEAAADPDAADDMATIAHQVSGGGYAAAQVESVEVTVTDDTPPAQVSGLVLGSVVTGLTVAWDLVPDADGYRVQWRSGGQVFDDAAADGREAVLDPTTTSYQIQGLTSLKTYIVRVLATNAGFMDGAPSEERSAAPLPARAVIARRHADGTPIADETVPVGSSLRLSVRFEGVNTPTGFAVDDLATAGGTITALRTVQEDGAAWYLADVEVTPGAPEVTVRVWEDAIHEGSTEAAATYPVARLSAALASGAATPVRGDVDVTVTFSEPVPYDDRAGAGGTGSFEPEHDLQIVNGRLVSAHAETAARYRVVVRPDGDLEGELQVTLPAEAVAAAGDTNNRNLAATFTIEVDTEVDDATLAALTMEATTLADTAVTLVPEFDPEITTYRAEAESIYDVLTTITATARDRETEVTITPVDYDRIRPGHQVQLVTTDQTITITVTAEDGVTMKEYTVTAARRLPPGKLVLANTPGTMSEGGSAQYTVSLSMRPPWQVAVNLAVSGDDDVTVSPEALTYNPAHGNWDRARTITVRAAEDDDAEDDVATVTHTVVEEPFPDHRYLAPAESFTVRVDDPKTPGQVTGVSVTEVYRGLEVEWTAVAGGADAYRVQWKSGSEQFADAADDGREALVAGAATEYTISGLTALQTYTVRVIAVNTGHGDGTPSAEVSGSPVQAEVRMRRTSADGGTVIDDDTIPVRGSFWMAVAFAGAAEPVGVTADDFEVTGGSIDEFFETRGGGVSVYRLRIVVADGVASVTFTVREDALEGGRNASASVTYPVGDPLRVTFEADSEAPLRSRMTLTMRTSLAIVDDTGADEDASGFSPSEDLTVENGWLDGVSRISSMEYRFGIVPRGKFEGTLRVRVPRGVMQAEEEEHAFNEAATFEIEVDTLTDDATLASLAVTAAGASGGEPVALSPRFIAAARSYQASVPYAVETVTVAAAARDKEGRTAIVPTDADRDADGHQVDLAEGATAITITVTAEDGVTTRDYTVTVDRAVPEREIGISATSLTVAEGSSGTYTVRLHSRPTGSVIVAVSGAERSDLSVLPESLTFDAVDWAAPRPVRVTAGHDADAGADRVVLSHTASGADYGGAEAVSLTVTVADDDRPALVVSEQVLTLQEEAGSTGYTVQLATEPDGSVVVVISGVTGTDLRLSRSELRFDSSDWDQQQTIDVEAADDPDGVDDMAELKHHAGGADYDAAPAAVLRAMVEDDDQQGLQLSAATLTVPEGDAAHYTVALTTEPTGTVTVAITGAAGADLTVAPTALTFAAADWKEALTVTVTSAHDADGMNAGTTLRHRASGADYGTVAPVDLPVTVTDDDNRVPGAPGSLTAAAVGHNRIDLRWTAPTDRGGHAISGYRIEVSKDGNAWTELVADTGSTGTTYRHTDLPAAATRHYRVSARNVRGFGTSSNEASASTPLPIVNISEDLEVDEGVGTRQLRVSLNNRSERVVTASYATRDGTAREPGDYVELRGMLAFSPGETVKTFDIEIVDDAAAELVEELYVVVSDFTGGVGGRTWTTVKVFDDDRFSDNLLSALTLADGDGNPISLAPTAFAPATTAYTAVVGHAVTAVTLEATTNHPHASVTIADDDDTATPAEAELDLEVGNNPLTVTVTAEDGMSTRTYTVAVTRLAKSPGQVTGVTAAVGDGRLTVRWNAVTGANGYKVQWKSGMQTFANASSDSREVALAGSTSYGLSGLSNGTAYTVRVIATRNGAADGPPSAEVTATPAQPALTISDGSAEEGDAVQLEVSLSHAGANEITVGFAVADGTAAAGDYVRLTDPKLVFGVGVTERTIAITTVEDTIDEDDETFTVTLGTAINASVAAGVATGTITDDDGAPSISIENGSGTEGAGVAFAVKLSNAAVNEITVRYGTSIEQGDTASAADFTGVSGATLTIGAGATEGAITIATTEDATDEEDETFTVTLSDPSPNAELGSGYAATGTIADDDPLPKLGVANVRVNETVGGTTAEFTVSLKPASAREVTVEYATSDVNATAGSDYTAATGTLTFAAGDRAATVTVTVADDSEDENEETFTVTLSQAENAIIESASATGTIIDNDSLPSISIWDARGPEGEGIVFAVELSHAETSAITVDYATSIESHDTALDHDLSSVDATLTIGAGQVEGSITIMSVEDTVEEADETFTVTLSSPSSNAQLSSARTATGTIVDDDASDAALSDLALADGDGNPIPLAPVEFRPGRITYTAQVGHAVTAVTLRATARHAEATVAIMDDDDTGTPAEAELDLDVGENALKMTVTAEDGVSKRTYTVTVTRFDESPGQVMDVALAVGDGLLTVGWSAVSGADGYRVQWKSGVQTFATAAADGREAAVAGAATSYDLSGLSNGTAYTVRVIATKSGAPDGTPSRQVTATPSQPLLTIADGSAEEGEEVELEVTLSHAGANEITVSYATADATAGSADYRQVTGATLTIGVGATAATIAIATIEDTTDEPDETFTVSLGKATNAGVAAGVATGTITDDDLSNDAALSVLTLEDGDGNQIALTPAVFAPATTGYTATVARAVTAVTLKATARHAGAVLAIAGDTDLATPDEAELDLAEGANTLTVTVTAEDGLSTRTYTVTVTRAGTAPGQVMDVALVVGDGLLTVGWSAVSGADGYRVQWKSGVQTFANAGADGREAAVAAATTSYDLSRLSNGTAYTVRVIVTRSGAPDGAPSVEVTATPSQPSITIAGGSAEEGEEVELEVTLSHAGANEITAGYATADGTAGTGDYSPVTDGTLTFSAGTTVLTIMIATIEDAVDEENETFTVTLGTATNAIVAVGVATATITDDDGTPSILIADASGTEGDGVVFAVTLSNASASAITVQYATSIEVGDTASAADFTAVSGAVLTIGLGETEGAITIATTEDTTDEEDETFTVTLSEPSSNAELGSADTATGTITDDDLSNDAALSVLTLEDGDGNQIALTPAVFAPATTGYTATVARAVTAVTLKATARHAGAVLAIAGDTDLATPDEAELDLAEGANTLTVTVTAEDGLSTRTYTVTVTRAGTAPGQVMDVALAVGDGLLTVGWSAVSGADGYKVQWKSGTLTFATAAADGREAAVAGAATSYDLSGLSNGTAYTVRVIATKSGAPDGTPSAEVTATPAQPSLTIADGSAEEGEAAELAVTLSHAGANEITVGYTTADGTAGTGDYSPVTDATLTFSAGTTVLTIMIATIEDTIDEPAETFTVTLGTATNASVAVGVATATITDDDGVEPEGTMTLSVVRLGSMESNQREAEVDVCWDTGSPIPTGSDVTIEMRARFGWDDLSMDYEHSSPYSAWQVIGHGDSFTACGSTGTDVKSAMTELFRGTPYTVQMRTRRGGTVLRLSPEMQLQAPNSDSAELHASLSGPLDREGRPIGTATGAFVMELSFTDPMVQAVTVEMVQGLAAEDFDVTNGTVQVALWDAGTYQVTATPAALGQPVTVGLRANTVLGVGAGITDEGGNAYTRPNSASNTVTTQTALPSDLPSLSVADARVQEASGAQLLFAVQLSPASEQEVTVNYRTGDGTATAGLDYEAASGTLTFIAGETARMVAVTVLGDLISDGGETLILTLSDPVGARIGDGEATGTIDNDDPLPRAWLARLGRTVAGHALDAVQERLRGVPETRATIAGHRLGAADSAAAERDEQAEREAAAFAAWLWPDTPRPLGAAELVPGSSFVVSGTSPAAPIEQDDAARWTVWGRGAWTGFTGSDDGLAVDGEVATGTLGADVEWDRWLLGVALAYSDGSGTYTHDSGEHAELAGWLVSAHPYARVALHERLELWGLLGYGLLGELSVREPAVETDLGLVMGALGLRGTLLSAADSGGLQLAARADGLLVRTGSDTAPGLAATTADVARWRLLLEAGYHGVALLGGQLIPALEVGARLDDGDAERGAALVMGGSLRYTAPGVSLEAGGQGTLAPQEWQFREWGVSGSLRLDPGAAGRGLAVGLAPAWGGTATSAAALWTLADTERLAAAGPPAAAARLDAELSYGFDWATPYAALSLEPGGARTWRVGGRAQPHPGLDLSVEGTLREHAGNLDPDGHTVTLKATWRW